MLTVYVVLIGLDVSYKKILLDMLLPLHFYVHRLLPLTYWSKNSIFLKHDCLSFSSDNLSCKVWCFSFFVNREDRRYQISCKGYRRVVHYHWETKVIQRFMARDEIVVLHVTHTDRDRVVMKQRPSWLHCVSLKTKIPGVASAPSWCAIGSWGHWFIRQRRSSLMDGTQSNARPIRCSPNRREKAFAGREINK